MRRFLVLSGHFGQFGWCRKKVGRRCTTLSDEEIGDESVNFQTQGCVNGILKGENLQCYLSVLGVRSNENDGGNV